MSLVEVKNKKYPIIDDLKVPEDVIQSWQKNIDLLAKIVDVPAALIMRVHSNDIEVFLKSYSKGNVYKNGEKAMLDTGLYCETVMDSRSELLVPSATKDPDWDCNPDIELGMISYCGLPLIWPNGEIFGTICVLDVKENHYSKQYRDLLAQFQQSIQLSLQSIYNENELLNEKRRTRSYLDTVQNVLIALDCNGLITMVNPAGCRLLGYNKEELIGQSWFQMCLIQPDGMNKAYSVFLKIMSGNLESIDYTENTVVCKDDNYRFMAWHNSCLYDNDGKITGMLSSGEDISDRHEAEEALIAAHYEARRASKAKSDFLASMSHELRTPLNAILGFSQLLLLETKLDDCQQKNLQEVFNAGQHLLELINKILDLSKIEAGRIELLLEPVDIESLIIECMDMVHLLADENRISLINNGFEDIVIKSDRIQLKQVILNLLTNAIKYNKSQGSVTLGMELVNSEFIRIYIIDTGVGIPPKRISEIFNPFSRLGFKNSEIQGTGLGLTLTKQIIQELGGSLNVKSVEGTGSTFSVDFPMKLLLASNQEQA